MCVVSMVYDHYRQGWPTVTTPGTNVPCPTVPIVPSANPPFTGITLTPSREATALDLFEQLVDVAERLDELLGLPDCEDPRKATWLDEVRERVRQHEAEKVEQRLAR